MRRSQWFVLAVVFLLTAIFFQYLGSTTASASQTMQAENLIDLTKVADEKTWTEAFGIAQLSKGGFANSLFIVSQVHYAVSNLCWAIFLACVICGFIEPRAEKSKK